jgi:hypothetical protein
MTCRAKRSGPPILLDCRDEDAVPSQGWSPVEDAGVPPSVTAAHAASGDKWPRHRTSSPKYRW